MHMKTKKRPRQKRLLISGRYIPYILIFCLSINSIVPLVCAHSPATMKATYNTENQDLQVAISHQVSSATTHYIAKIEIKKNGEIYNTTLYTSQPTTNSFTYTYKVNATTGDVIDVSASCNQGGSKTTQITVGQDKNENDTSTPGFELIVLLGALIVSMGLLRRKYC